MAAKFIYTCSLVALRYRALCAQTSLVLRAILARTEVRKAPDTGFPAAIPPIGFWGGLSKVSGRRREQICDKSVPVMRGMRVRCLLAFLVLCVHISVAQVPAVSVEAAVCCLCADHI